MAGKFTTTTKDVGLLYQLEEDGQLKLAPEFQRNAIWPRAAKAYLIDTILSERPIPVLYFQRGISAQTNRVMYSVVDGQQRLSALFQFMENRFSLTESDPSAPWYRKRWKTLSNEERERILSYDFVVQELSGYSDLSIRDMFTRMNRFVVALSPQELRHANQDGAFKNFVEELGKWPRWTEAGIFSAAAASRMKSDEFVAELAILLLEGPQDKKKSIDFYYSAFTEQFPQAAELSVQIDALSSLAIKLISGDKKSPYRKPANFYALVGALSEIESGVENDNGLAGFDQEGAIARLQQFAAMLLLDEERRPATASKFLTASSRQTDNLQPRLTRIEILRAVLVGED